MATTQFAANNNEYQYKTKNTKHVTTAYRQNNYLIVDNQPNSVTVSVYFRVSKRNIIKPNLKKTMRSIKNKANKFDEGQCLIREITSDTPLLPKKELLIRLGKYLNKYESTMDIPTFEILWKRLTDYQTLRHVEKSLLVIQYLLDNNDNASFSKYLKQRKNEFIKLQNYHYKVDGSDIGQNVRERAFNVYQKLFVDVPKKTFETVFNEEDLNKEDVNKEDKFSDIPMIKSKSNEKKKKTKTKTKKKRKKKIEVTQVTQIEDNNISKHVTEDLLTFDDTNTFNITQVEGTNDNPFRTDNNGNHDPFDIFGELPEAETAPQQHTQFNNDNADHTASFHDLLSNSAALSASSPTMKMNISTNGNKNESKSKNNNYDFGVNNFDNMFEF